VAGGRRHDSRHPRLALLYLYAVGRFGASRRQIACFAGSLLLLAVAFWTPLHHLGLHYC